MSSTDSAVLAGVAAFMGAYLVVVLVLAIVMLIAYWKIFKKAGEPGWKSIIPVYNSYTLYKFTWETKFFWIFLGVSFVAGIISGLLGSSSGAGLAVSAIGSLIGCVITIMQLHKLSKAFGHGVGFTLGLIFLSPIFVLILAFGKSEYQGKA